MGFETPRQARERRAREAVEAVQRECDLIMVNHLNYLLPEHPEWTEQIVHMYYAS